MINVRIQLKEYIRMKREIVRLQKIELRNLKNVGYGCVKFATKNSVAADILGLYGQNVPRYILKV